MNHSKRPVDIDERLAKELLQSADAYPFLYPEEILLAYAWSGSIKTPQMQAEIKGAIKVLRQQRRAITAIRYGLYPLPRQRYQEPVKQILELRAQLARLTGADFETLSHSDPLFRDITEHAIHNGLKRVLEKIQELLLEQGIDAVTAYIETTLKEMEMFEDEYGEDRQ